MFLSYRTHFPIRKGMPGLDMEQIRDKGNGMKKTLRNYMKRNYGLTDTETQVMDLLWQAEAPMAFREIMGIATNEWGKVWKAQTLNTYLNVLQKKGLVRARKGEERFHVYYAACTKDEHIHNWTMDMLNDCFGGSFALFMKTYAGDRKLSEKDADELREFL